MEDGSGDSYGELNSFQKYLIPFHLNIVQGFQIADLCPPSLICADGKQPLDSAGRLLPELLFVSVSPILYF
jgi:hypothetical protein